MQIDEKPLRRKDIDERKVKQANVKDAEVVKEGRKKSLPS